MRPTQRTSLVLISLLILAACGGGGGGGGSPAPTGSSSSSMLSTSSVSSSATSLSASASSTSSGTSSASANNSPTLSPDCTACAATSATLYSGAGIGVWAYHNSTSASTTLPISISGLSNKRVTLVYTNLGSSAVTMPSISLEPSIAPSISADTLSSISNKDPAPASIIAERERFAASFQGKTAPALLNKNLMFESAIAPDYAVGESRTITEPYAYLAYNTIVTTTVSLKKQVTTTDGTVVNFWVDDTEFGTGKMSQTTVDTFATRFASGSNSIYSLATGLIGKPWGAHGYSNLIGATQPINIIFYNSNGGNWAGYFASSDLYTSAYDSNSNAWLSFYLASDVLYEGSSHLSYYTNYASSTLAHEFTHMIHNYQRSILLGKSFTTWLNELAAMGMEDIIASKIFSDGTQKIRDVRYKGWISGGNFNCQQDYWPDSNLTSTDFCTSSRYSVNGAWSAFMNRQYGLDYYKALFSSSASDSTLIMDGAIKAAGGGGYQESMRRWGASIAMLPAASTPSGHGYPARTDGSYSMVGFDGTALKTYRVLPSSVPSTLAPYAHFPVERTNVSGTYAETLTVPANTAISVVIQ